METRVPVSLPRAQRVRRESSEQTRAHTRRTPRSLAYYEQREQGKRLRAVATIAAVPRAAWIRAIASLRHQRILRMLQDKPRPMISYDVGYNDCWPDENSSTEPALAVPPSGFIFRSELGVISYSHPAWPPNEAL